MNASSSLNENEKININELIEATDYLKETKLVYETPLISLNGLNLNDSFNNANNLNVFLKLENMQTTGSFKLRGVLNQFRNIKLTNNDTNNKIVTFSGGNYGKTFAYVTSKLNLNKTAKVILPATVSQAKYDYINSKGLETEKVNHKYILDRVEEHVQNGYKLIHPIDDKNLICGYSSITFEILKQQQQQQQPDIVLVCCGGGSLLAGISIAFGLLKPNTLIYGVEPETANTMSKSFQLGYPVKMTDAYSIATGLSPPITGHLAYHICKTYVKDILLVSDFEIKQTCKKLFEMGIKAELSGCAAMAALLFNKLPKFYDSNKLNVLVIISGGNISAEEINLL
jgi:threonine dehydratase